MENTKNTFNFDRYMNEGSKTLGRPSDALFSEERRLIRRKKDFRFRYFSYLDDGMPFFDRFNKDYRVANYFAQVLAISCDYIDEYAECGWNMYDVATYLSYIRQESRVLGYFGKFKIKIYGRRVRVYLKDVAYVCRDANQVIETMYDIAGYLASQKVEECMSGFVGSFMHREYDIMNALSTS